MTGSKSDYAEKITLDMFLGGQTYTPTADVYIALSNQPYDDAATGTALNEVPAGVGYARIAVANTLTEWPAATGTNPTTKTNANDITFGTATGAGWGNVQSAYILDAATNGNVLYGGDLDSPVTVGAGSSLTILAGTYVVNED